MPKNPYSSSLICFIQVCHLCSPQTSGKSLFSYPPVSLMLAGIVSIPQWNQERRLVSGVQSHSQVCDNHSCFIFETLLLCIGNCDILSWIACFLLTKENILLWEWNQSYSHFFFSFHVILLIERCHFLSWHGRCWRRACLCGCVCVGRGRENQLPALSCLKLRMMDKQHHNVKRTSVSAEGDTPLSACSAAVNPRHDSTDALSSSIHTGKN